jgi:Ca-activated chloride channel homolog
MARAVIMEFFGIMWGQAETIWFLPILVGVIAIIIRNYVTTKKALKLLASPRRFGELFKNFSLRRLFVKACCLGLACISIFIALMRPQWGKVEQTVIQEGRDLVIMLDISRSMRAADMRPNRLEFAKFKIQNLIKKLACERISLIVFSGNAFVLCPLTNDYDAFTLFLKQVDTELISSGTTSIDKALSKAIEIFGRSEGRKTKLALLLTDGEDFSTNLNNLERKAVEENITLFALGIGSPEGAPIPTFDHTGKQNGHEVDEAGNIALSKLNKETLTKLTNALHGVYLHATYDDNDINAIYQRVTTFEKEKFHDKKLSLYHDQYPWFLGAAWLLLALEWIL